MAALTTRDAVLETAPELAGIPDPAPPALSEWRRVLLDVELQVPAAAWGFRAELAQRLWVAHVLTLNHPELERRQLSGVTLGGMSKQYAVGGASASSEARAWLSRTRHGQRLLDMMEGLLVAAGPIVL
jgi:hypothetical protein